jgi:hypothetical protein
MIDTQANPRSYLRLMGLVALRGIASAPVTFVFIVLGNGSIALIWEQAALALGRNLRLGDPGSVTKAQAEWRACTKKMYPPFPERYMDYTSRMEYTLAVSQCYPASPYVHNRGVPTSSDR